MSTITIEDMDSFIDALKYSQTLVNTANIGADLAFDYLRSYDYYGSVRMAVAANTMVAAQEIKISGYDQASLFQYSQLDMTGFFYLAAGTLIGSSRIAPITNITDASMMTTSILTELSISQDGNINTEALSYLGSLVFDPLVDSAYTVFPTATYDQLFYKSGEIIAVDSIDWNVRLKAGNGTISKDAGKYFFEASNLEVNGNISSANITFTSLLETKEEILKYSIREDGRIIAGASVPVGLESSTNMFMLSKLELKDYKTFGDEIELHLETIYTDSELKEKVNLFIETSGSDLIYGGEDAFITQNQANMLAEYIYRKVTSVSKSSIKI